MNDIDRACAAFRTLLEEQQARVAGMTAEQVDYTNKATVTIGLVDGDGIGPIIMEQAVRALEALLAGSMSLQGLPVSLLTAYAGCLAAAVAALALERRLDRKLVGDAPLPCFHGLLPAAADAGSVQNADHLA